jgi:hypothetical protein
MASLSGFNANEVEPNAGFDPIPEGWYPACITESEMKPTKAGTGEYLKLAWEIVDGKYKNRKVWNNLNLKNPNAVAVNIARGDLSAICRAIGVLTPNDSAELHNRPILIHLRLEKEKGKDGEETGNMTNVIKGYKPINEATTPSRTPTPAPQPAGNGNAAPWGAKR